MPTLNYSPVPSVEPTVTPPSTFQTIQPTPNAFGAAQGQALSNLGQTFERAGSQLADVAIQRQHLFNQVAAADASTKWQDATSKILYGDPDNPNDVGFYGLKGDAAMRQFPVVRKQLDDLLREHRTSLQNPMQQVLFDQETRRLRSYLMSETGRHYDQENSRWTQSVYKGQTEQALQNGARAIANGNDFDTFLQQGAEAITKGAIAAGKSAEEAKAEVNHMTTTFVEMQADKLSADDPRTALQFIQNHRDQFKDPEKYLQLENRVKAQAIKKTAQDIANGVPGPGLTSNLVRGGAVEGHINYGNTGALGDPSAPGWADNNLTTVQSPGGASFKVHKAAANDFQGFLSDLERAGYKIDPTQSGGYVNRKMRGGESLSEHAFGTAIDINWNQNLYTKDGRRVTDLPPQVAELAAKHNLEWGGNWHDPIDAMHFQWRGPQGADNNFGGLRKPGVQAAKSEGGFQTFATPEAGVQAVADNLRKYADGGVVTESNPTGKPLNTIRDIVTAWAPPKENNTQLLIDRAVKNTGFSADQPLDMKDPVVLSKMVAATIRNEQGDRLPVSQALISKVASGLPAQDQLIVPPPEPGEYPDAEVPGLLGELKRITQDPRIANAPANFKADLFNAAVKETRQKYNMLYTEQTRQRQQAEREQKAGIETAENDYFARLFPKDGSPSDVTVQEIANDPRLATSDAKKKMILFFEQQTKPDPLKNISQVNSMKLFSRITEPDGTVDKITTPEPIEKAFLDGQLTRTDFSWLRDEVIKQRTASGSTLLTTKNDFLKSYEFPISKSNPLMGKIDNDGMIQYGRFKFFVDQQVQQYEKEGKNPINLFNPDSSDYLGNPKTIARFQKPLSESMKDTAKQFAPNPEYRTFGPTTVAPVPPPPRKLGESPEDWAKRTGR